MKLSEHWTLEELFLSSTATRLGIENNPPPWVVENLRQLVLHSLEPARMLLGKTIVADSGYRCPKLNVAIGGVMKYLPDGSIDWDHVSQHVKGEAADLLPPAGMTVEDFFVFLAKNVPFDQLIQEGHWVHISYREKCRGQMLQATFTDGKASYTPRFVEGLKP